MGLRQRINSVSQSPAVTKAVLFSKERSSEIMTKRRAKRDAAIKSRLARIERLKAEGKYNPIIIPADHPMKIAWDVLTIILTILSALRTRAGMVFAAASADWTEEDDWAYDDLDDEDDDEEEEDGADGLDDNSLLDRRGSKDSLNEADEPDGVSRQLYVEDDAGKVTLGKLSVLLPDLDDMSDDPHSASTGAGRSNQLHQKRIRSVSEGGDAFGSSITPSSSSGSLRMRRTSSQLNENDEEEEVFS